MVKYKYTEISQIMEEAFLCVVSLMLGKLYNKNRKNG